MNAFTKSQLINYIYKTIELSNYKYKLLETEDDLEYLTNTDSDNTMPKKYYVSANFTGTNCLLVFCKMRERNYSYLIDRKTLTFTQNQLDYDKVNLIPVDINLDNSIYNGTIMDGVIIRNDKIKDKFFVMTDVYYFRGHDMSKDNMNHKLMNVTTYLDNNLKLDKSNTINLTVNKLYEIEELETLINEDIPKTKGYHVRGISFYPEISGTKLLYIFQQNQKVKSSVEETKEEKRITKYVSKSDESIKAVFDMRKTDIPDVYKLFLVETIKDIKTNKTQLKTKNMGIAYIPTTEISKLCKEIYKESTTNRALVECKFDHNKNKWTPRKQIKDMKIPTNISEIENKFEIIEEIVYSEEDYKK